MFGIHKIGLGELILILAIALVVLVLVNYLKSVNLWDRL